VPIDHGTEHKFCQTFQGEGAQHIFLSKMGGGDGYNFIAKGQGMT
jgi:hypothetical protein